MATHSDESIKIIIDSLIKNGGVVAHVKRATGFNYGTIAKYRNDWREGRLNIPGLPPYQPLEIKPAIDETSSLKALQSEATILRKQITRLQQENAQLAEIASLADMVKNSKKVPPSWVTKAPSKGNRGVIATAFLSDVHLDEVITPEQVNYINEYNRPIAEKRLANFFNNTVEIARDYLAGFRYEGLVLPLGGDIFAGIIHEELVQTNAGTIFQSLDHWADPFCAGIKLLRDAFGRVYIPCVVGNHGRLRRKPHAKLRVQDNFEYLFYKFLQRLLQGEKGIEFAISEAADQPYQVYNTRYLLTHGDQFKGGSGIAGMWTPLMLGNARKLSRESAVQRPYDYLIMGHWHQLSFMNGVIVNGSVSGYDEYAYTLNLGLQPPQQAFWITDSEHGVTIKAPIHVASKDERYSFRTGSQAMVNFST